MKEGCFNVRSHNFQVMVSGISQDDTDTGHLGNRRISLIKVLRTLTKSLGNNTGFLLPTNDGAVRVILVSINPTDANSRTRRREISSFKGISLSKTGHLPIHSTPPHRRIRTGTGFVIGIRRFSKVIDPGSTQVSTRINMSEVTVIQ